MIKRQLSAKILEALTVSPIVLVNGPRQAGKTTLVQLLAANQYEADYISFDDATYIAAAASNPTAFLEQRNKPLIIDEVQMVPEIFRPLKIIVDNLRYKDKANCNGRYLLTGSANIMALPKLSDALVGRMAILTLYPLSALELFDGKGNFLNNLFENSFVPGKSKQEFTKLLQVIKLTTFPEISSKSDKEREIWFEGYLTTILQRDVRIIAEIEKAILLPF
jgi:predicted AAA+ superfamily ATPase